MHSQNLTNHIWKDDTSHGLEGFGEPAHLPVEELLQPFIGIINAKLFKGIFLEAFEAINIQYAQLQGRFSSPRSQGFIDSPNNCFEEVIVDCLGQCISGVTCGAVCEVHRYALLMMLASTCSSKAVWN